MRSMDLRQVRWSSVILHAAYVLALWLAMAYFGSLFGITQSQDFVPALILLVAMAVILTGYRVALRAGQQPVLHGFLVGLLVAGSGLVLSLFSSGLTVTEVAGFFLQLLGGLLGGRMAQRVLQQSS